MKPLTTSLAAISVMTSLFACSANEGTSRSSDSDLTQGQSCELAKPGTFACPQDYDPVCGCDGKTYSNACAASRVVANATPGECLGDGGKSDVDAGTNTDAGSCVIANPTPPQFCAQVYDPVCGCDGKTYSNDCDAASFVTRTTPGACP